MAQTSDHRYMFPCVCCGRGEIAEASHVGMANGVGALVHHQRWVSGTREVTCMLVSCVSASAADPVTASPPLGCQLGGARLPAR